MLTKCGNQYYQLIKRSKSWVFWHTFTKVIDMQPYFHVEMLTEEQVYLYTERLRAKDESVIEPLILHHIPLAAHFAGQIEKQFGYREGECLSAGFAALVGTINRIFKSETPILHDNNITPYLIICIKGAILDYLQHDHLMPVSRTTLKKGIKNLPRLTPITMLPSGFETSIDHLLEHRDYVESDLQGTYIEMGLSERDIKILQMKLEGYTYQEIADQIGLSLPMIGKIFHSIQDKFIALFHFRPKHARKQRSDKAIEEVA